MVEMYPTEQILARNTLLNFISRVAPLFVAIITIPFIAQGFGAERFGILLIVWVDMVNAVKELKNERSGIDF